MCDNTDYKYPNSFSAYILDQDSWNEIKRREGKAAGTPYIVPEHGVISIRFPEEYRGKRAHVRVFVEVK